MRAAWRARCTPRVKRCASLPMMTCCAPLMRNCGHFPRWISSRIAERRTRTRRQRRSFWARMALMRPRNRFYCTLERRYRRISCASPGCLKLSEQKKHSFTPRARVTAFTGTAVIPFICINILHDSDSRTSIMANHPGRSNAPPVWCIPGESNGRRARDGFQCPGKERGITILAKNCAIEYLGTHINIVDTPGHADFGGEVERVLSMVDSVLLLVDAVEGPMPQTRFVTKKALAQGLQSIVVVNKIDRPGARADWVINQTFDLFDKLGASEQQLDFPVIYASGLHGYAGHDARVRTGTLQPLFEAILQYVPVRTADPNGPLQLQIAALDYSS